ncbi:hypothetical protein SeMB42_g05307, partial [Synchytrium endobioticum]
MWHPRPLYRSSSYLDSDDDTLHEAASIISDSSSGPSRTRADWTQLLNTGTHRAPPIAGPLAPGPRPRPYADPPAVPPPCLGPSHVHADITVLDHPLPPSRFFSAERAEQRQQQGIRDGLIDLHGIGPTERIKFEALIAANTDDVTIEARSLLQQWMDNPGIGAPDDVMDDGLSMPDPSGSAAADLMQRLNRAQARHQARDVVHDAAGRRRKSTDVDVIQPNAECSQDENRHSLARERREVLAMQRRAETMRRIEEKRVKAAAERAKRDAEQERARIDLERVRFQRDMAERTRKEAMDRSGKVLEAHIAVDERRKVAAEQRANEKAEHEAGLRRIVDQEFAQMEARKRLELARDGQLAAEREQRAARADELFTLQKMKCLKRHLAAWRDASRRGHDEISRMQVIWTWRRRNASWCMWRQTMARRVARREAERVERELQRAQQRMARAARHDRTATLSKALLALQIGSALARDERETARKHAERARKMQLLLAKMQAQRNASYLPASGASPTPRPDTPCLSVAA